MSEFEEFVELELTKRFNELLDGALAQLEGDIANWKPRGLAPETGEGVVFDDPHADA